jgi:hypothetical protein
VFIVTDTGHEEPLPLPLLLDELPPELLLDELLELLPPPELLALPLLVPEPLPLDEPEPVLLPPPLPEPPLLEDPVPLDVPLLLDSPLLDEPLDPLLLPLPDVLPLPVLLPPSAESGVASPACPWAQAHVKPDSAAKQTTNRFMERPSLCWNSRNRGKLRPKKAQLRRPRHPRVVWFPNFCDYPHSKDTPCTSNHHVSAPYRCEFSDCS